MTETKSVRESLASSELFGFDTGCWARGLVTGRRTASRRGAKGRADAGDILQDETPILAALNQVETAAAEPAAEVAQTDEPARA
jgi:hypothetical protein